MPNLPPGESLTQILTLPEVPGQQEERYHDIPFWCVTVLACLVSFASFLYFFRQGTTLAYNDAISHMEIARRVIDSPVAGPTQLGSVWLPMSHILMLPLIWSNTLYFDGIAGSAVSMLAYVCANALLYKIIRDLTDSWVAAIAGTLVFMANPNILYMQSTPMTELPLFASVLGMVYGLQRWIREVDNYNYLIGAGITVIIGTLTRYEAWVLWAVTIPIVPFILWRKGASSTRIGGVTFLYGLLAGPGILAWFVWNGVFFGNPIAFQVGKYAKPSLWVGSADKAVGHWSLALQTYWYAMVDDLTLPVVVLMFVGIAVVLVMYRRLVFLPALALLFTFPFFVYAIESGQRPLHVVQISGSLYNVRFGLLMLLPAAIFTGCIVGQAASRQAYRLTLTTLTATYVVTLSLYIVLQGYLLPASIATLSEPLTTQRNTPTTVATSNAATFLHAHYTGGLVLAQFFGNEELLFQARITPGVDVYEGSNRLWTAALADPVGQHIEWVVMHTSAGTNDAVNALAHSREISASYKLVYRNDQYSLYRRSP